MEAAYEGLAMEGAVEVGDWEGVGGGREEHLPSWAPWPGLDDLGGLEL